MASSARRAVGERVAGEERAAGSARVKGVEGEGVVVRAEGVAAVGYARAAWPLSPR
ncbi:hypothetical protein A6P39_024235 [Streptomyces sp. FXJ1.172]|uniref:hypothetical protein n=1 Tax=Streptomyces sp. FXJ1.172 TaxID=710705 RepID=UPI00133194FD|nr:hypothetical protein [Streptomyces sp. FXJ1.172]WEP00516.1 hypothetical protein A6P39_024235 [Streptomyces sp. FXJ1.172]